MPQCVFHAHYFSLYFAVFELFPPKGGIVVPVTRSRDSGAGVCGPAGPNAPTRPRRFSTVSAVVSGKTGRLAPEKQPGRMAGQAGARSLTFCGRKQGRFFCGSCASLRQSIEEWPLKSKKTQKLATRITGCIKARKPAASPPQYAAICRYMQVHASCAFSPKRLRLINAQGFTHDRGPELPPCKTAPDG